MVVWEPPPPPKWCRVVTRGPAPFYRPPSVCAPPPPPPIGPHSHVRGSRQVAHSEAETWRQATAEFQEQIAEPMRRSLQYFEARSRLVLEDSEVYMWNLLLSSERQRLQQTIEAAETRRLIYAARLMGPLTRWATRAKITASVRFGTVCGLCRDVGVRVRRARVCLPACGACVCRW